MNSNIAEWCPNCGGETEMEHKLVQQPCLYCGMIQKPCSICPVNSDCGNCPFFIKENELLKESTQVIVKYIDSGLDNHSNVERTIGSIGTVTGHYKTVSGKLMHSVDIEIDNGMYNFGYAHNEIEKMEAN